MRLRSSMKFFHVFYNLYDSVGAYVDYGMHPVMSDVYPIINDVHDEIARKEVSFRVSINNITEVEYSAYFANLSDSEINVAREKYRESIFGEIKVLTRDEMESMGLDEERMNEISDAIAMSIEESVDYDLVILRVISSIIKQYSYSSFCNPTTEFYERYQCFDIDDLDEQTQNEIKMSYKYELAKLANMFDSYIDELDEGDASVDKLYQAFYQLSKMLPGMWN